MKIIPFEELSTFYGYLKLPFGLRCFSTKLGILDISEKENDIAMRLK